MKALSVLIRFAIPIVKMKLEERSERALARWARASAPLLGSRRARATRETEPLLPPKAW